MYFLIGVTSALLTQFLASLVGHSTAKVMIGWFMGAVTAILVVYLSE